MAEIVAQAKRVNDPIGEISAASSEQSSGIGQIGGAVAQLYKVTQQNAALVEESAAAAESLKQQATSLAEAVAVFKLGASDTYYAPVKAPQVANPVKATPVVRRVTTAAAPKRIAPGPRPEPVREAAPVAHADDDWTTF